jgi:hypothetical protein
MVALHVGLIVVRVSRAHGERARLSRAAFLLGLLLLAQISLGIASYFGKFTSSLRLPIEILVLLTTTHLVIGALMLATSLVLTLHCFRLSTAAKTSDRRAMLKEQLSL